MRAPPLARLAALLALLPPQRSAARAAAPAPAPPSPAAAKLQSDVATAIAAGAPAFEIANGLYSFGESSFMISGAIRISIGGRLGELACSVQLEFAPGFGVAVASATDATLHDICIDYSPLPYAYGRITALAPASLTVTLDRNSLTLEDLGLRYPPHDTWPPPSVFDAVNGDLVGSVCPWGAPAPATLQADGTYVVTCAAGKSKVGDSFVAATRVGFTLALSRTERVHVRDVTIFSASYMAITEFEGEGGNIYERVRVVPPNPGRPLASNADGFHSSGMRVGPQLLGVEIRNLLDDYFNVHNTFQLVVASNYSATILVGDYQLFSGDSSTLYGTQQTLSRVRAGDAVSWFPLNTFSFPPLGTSAVQIMELIEGPAAQALLAAAWANASALAKATPCSACHAGLNPFATAQLWSMSLAQASNASALSFLNIDSIAAIGAIVADCAFSGSVSNLGRFKSANGRIERTSFRNTLSQNLEIEPLQNWLEGSLGIHNVSIDSCTFEGTASSPVHMFGATDVRETNSTYLPSAAKALSSAEAPSLRDFTNIIAQQAAASASSPSWFDSLPTWHVPTSTVPDSPAVPADSPARDMVFGSPLSFSVFPVNSRSSFAVALTFLDDGGDRVQSLTVGSEVVSPHFAPTPKTIFAARFNISSAAVTPRPGGVFSLDFSFGIISGPNAILSAFVLYSSNSSDPAIYPVAPLGPSHDLPRLTPLPAAVDGAGDKLVLDLMGSWSFCVSPSAVLLGALRGDEREVREGLSALDAACSLVAIQVPGEYTLQGFRVPAAQPVIYNTFFTVPGAWAGLQVKLRFDAVYSDATAFVNGGRVGGHLGGFTPFELDVTAQLRSDLPNNLTVVVVSESLADQLSSATQYAGHVLGGITRKVYLMAVPPVSIADVHVVTTFAGANYTQAFLVLNVSVANDGAIEAPYASFTAFLSFRGKQEASAGVNFSHIPPNTVVFQSLTLIVSGPPLWDPEHPQLHDLKLVLGTAGPSETAMLRVGFRDVKVAGNHIVINGRAIKARGTTRHEAHPLTGRSLWFLEPAGKQWERDIAIFRDANINYIRTSHYPPAEELMIAADELGMLIELEMPFCWATGNAGQAAFNYTVQAQREAMVFNRNHPSVIQWSLGNESPWTANFAASLADYLREVDWTRPFMFDGGSQQPIPPLDVLSVHYPSFDGPGEYANATQPTLFGEYAHLNCYNRRELAADGGVRDIWGLGIAHMWELIMASPGTLGACYWAGIDDFFFMPTSGKPVGYGEWGVIDAWRRQKPETFFVRNIYSPVRLQLPAPGSSWAPHLSVANRHDFSDLAEVAFGWQILESGLEGQGSASGGPHTDGLVLTLRDLPAELAGTMRVNATSARGFLINSWEFALSAPPPTLAAAAGVAPSVVELSDGRLLIEDAARTFSWYVTAAGSVSGNTSAGSLLSSGPTLMVLAINDEGGTQLTEDMPPILPFNDPMAGWALASRTFSVVGDVAVVVLTGSYSDATGAFTLSFDGAARLQASYAFRWTAAASVAPRQFGLVFGAPASLAFLSWRRSAPWSAYPLDHIGRPAGDLVPTNVGPVPGNVSRTWSWSHDPSPLGDQDFRSTKHNVTVFELGDGAGRALALLSNGASQHGRAWVGSDGGVYLLAADLSNEGGNPFSREKVLPQPTIATGDAVAGAAVLQLGSALDKARGENVGAGEAGEGRA